MYYSFYSLTQRPFHTTPDPEFLYLSPSHKQALGSIIYGLEERKGFIAVTGEVGTGKTTILRYFLAQADNIDHIIYLLDPSLPFKDLLKVVLRELKHEPAGSHEAELVSQVQEVLIEQYRSGRTVVLLIDEAQNMPVATLESLRILSNLETSKDKLIQIVLVGQPELDELLRQHELRQLNQRIAMRASLVPLSRTESRAYILHRLAKAGSKGRKVFSRRALSLIIREAKGNPRLINVLCDNALVTGLGYKRKPVNARIAKEVIADLNGAPSWTSWRWVPISAAIGLCAIVTAWLVMPEFQGSWNAFPVVKLREFIDQQVEATRIHLSLKEREANMNGGDVASTHMPTSVSLETSTSHNGSHEQTSPAKAQSLITVTVRQGDTLEAMARSVYGEVTPQYMRSILDANPHLTNSAILFPGQKVVFPKIMTRTE
jgi:general secretion pathway protein A